MGRSDPERGGGDGATPDRVAVVGWGVGMVTVALVGSWSASFGSSTRWWAVPVALAVGAGLGPSLEAHRRVVGFLAPWAVLAAVLAVVYVCVPETDQFREAVVVFGAGFVVDLAGRGRWAPVPAVTVAAVVMWAGLYGATGRQGALVGTSVAFLPVLSSLLVLTPGHPRRAPAPILWSLIGLAAVAAGVVARTGGLGRSLGVALGVAVVAVGVWAVTAVAVITVASRRGGPSTP